MTKYVSIFQHNGIVGAESDIDNGEFINDVHNFNQLGIIVEPKYVRITSEALNIIKSSPKSKTGFAAIMLTDDNAENDVTASVGLLGKEKHLLGDKPGCVDISRDSDLSVLDLIDIDDSIETPRDFINFVES